MCFINLGAYVMRRYFFFIFTAILFSKICCASSINDSKVFVENVVNEALSVVNSSDSEDNKRSKLSESINKYLDIKWLSEKVFGSLGYNDLPVSDKSRVEAYLKNYLLKFYAGEGKLSAMVGAKLLPINDRDIELDEQKNKVKTKFSKNDSAKSFEITWVIKGKNIFYVEIEGISQLITLRSEMKAAAKNGLMEFITAGGF